MPTEKINIEMSITWIRLKNATNEPYKWGDKKKSQIEPNWDKQNVIYRWVKNSTEEIVKIGETERRLTSRINNYISATPNSSAGPVNKKVFNEQKKLLQDNDYLYLEFTDNVPGFNLKNKRERKLAESLLKGYYKPYLQ